VTIIARGMINYAIVTTAQIHLAARPIPPVRMTGATVVQTTPDDPTTNVPITRSTLIRTSITIPKMRIPPTRTMATTTAPTTTTTTECTQRKSFTYGQNGVQHWIRLQAVEDDHT